MNGWSAEPLWQTLDRLQVVHQLTAADTLTVGLTEYALTPRLPVRRDYKGFDKLKSLMGQGIIGVIIR